MTESLHSSILAQSSKNEVWKYKTHPFHIMNAVERIKPVIVVRAIDPFRQRVANYHTEVQKLRGQLPRATKSHHFQVKLIVVC